MVAFHPQRIDGNWLHGVVLDVHTLRSLPLGPDEHGQMKFDTTRSELGELVLRLKQRGDRSAATPIIAAAVSFLRPHRGHVDLIVPVPASTRRPFQPVDLLAEGIGAALDLPVAACVTRTRNIPPLKNVTNPEQRKAMLTGLHAVDAARTEGRNVLLIDDIYRSGATLRVITALLLGAGRAASVRVLVITRTRVNR